MDLPSTSADESRPARRPPRRPLEHWIVLALALIALAVFIALGLFIQPDPRGFGTHEKLGLPSCKPMEWWNIPCPGCGVTTSVSLVAHGQPWAAIVNQPFGFVMALATPVFAIWALSAHFRGRSLDREITRVRLGRWGVVLGACLVLAWIYKLALVRHWI